MKHIAKVLCILSLTILPAQAACNQASAVVGSGAVDFEPDDVLLTVLASNSLGGTIVNFADTPHAFTAEALISSSGVNGFTASKTSLTAGNLVINLNGTSSNPDATIDVGLNPPEPGSLGLVG